MRRVNAEGNGRQVEGRVKWFNLDRGFGFIVLDDGSGDAFLHVSVMNRDGIQSVSEQDKVRCIVTPSPKGMIVREVLEVLPETDGSNNQPVPVAGPEVRGTIKFFSRAGSYGFIEWDGGEDVYISQRCLARSQVVVVHAGQPVIATTMKGSKGLVADRITLLAQ